MKQFPGLIGGATSFAMIGLAGNWLNSRPVNAIELGTQVILGAALGVWMVRRFGDK